MGKLYAGNKPSKPYRMIDSYKDFQIWMNHDGRKWIQFKIVATKRKRKANYWISYNPEEQRFANGRDFNLMLENQIDLANYIVMICNATNQN